jgi:hypothetical protein
MRVELEERYLQFTNEYGVPELPKSLFRIGGDEETEEARRLLRERIDDKLHVEELREPAKGWFYAWMGPEDFRWFLPKMIKSIMEGDYSGTEWLMDRCTGRNIAGLTERERRAFSEWLDWAASYGYVQSSRERAAARLIKKLLATE